jgi:NlpC/P60 family
MNTPQQQHLVDWAHWFQKHSKSTAEVYTEGAKRMDEIGRWPLVTPINSDCSGFVTLLYWLAGLPDPNNCHYDHTGYTGTLLSNVANHHIPADQVQPGDLVVYGGGVGEHTAIVIEVNGPDIMTVSYGDNNGAIYCWVNAPHGDAKGIPVDGRTPQTFLRPSQKQVTPAKPVPLA